MNGSRRASPGETEGIPLVIAVAGHRQFPPDSRPRLEASVRELFDLLRRRYPSTPLRLLSGLAEGADRLAAKVALEQDVELVAVLPMPPDVFERDFPAEASRDEFRSLLARSTDVIVVQGDGNGAASESRYVRQGVFLARNCDVLLALWDGNQAEGAGGTAEVVRFQLEGAPYRYREADDLFEQRTGIVYHVSMPRDGEPADPPPARFLSPSRTGRSPSSELAVDPIFAAIDAFNRDCLDSASRVAAQGSSLPDEDGLVNVSPVSRVRLASFRRRFIRADRLAMHFQSRTWTTFKAILACSVLAMISLQIRTGIPVYAGVFLMLYLLLLSAAYGLYGWLKRNRYEAKAFDYRALAEGLRVQFFWELAGLNASTADHYLRRQQGVLDWIRRALLTSTMTLPDRSSGETATLACLEQVLQHWVGGQMRYFSETAEKQRRLQTRLAQAANALMLLGMVLALLRSVVGTAHWTTSLAAIPPFIAAAILLYGSHLALSEQAYQYQSMKELFQTADGLLRRRLAEGDVASAQRLVLELGKETLAENADWLVLHRRRPLTAPVIM